MPSKEKRVRVERGLYRIGSYYHACATPPGSRTPMWKALGRVGLMEARRLRDKFAAEVQGAQPVPARPRATFGELAHEWLAEQKLRLDAGEMSPRTFESYEMALRRHVLPEFGSRPVRSIQPDQLVSWIRRMRAAGYAPHTVHNYWAPINLALRYAVRHGVLPANPADRLTSSERPKPGSGRRRFLDKSEMQRLLDHAPARYRVALVCGLFSGLRLSELLGLTWGDIDLNGNTIRVQYQLGRDGKRRPLKTVAARRDVILMRELASELRKLRMASPFSGDSNLVFASTNGKTIGHRNLTARGLEKAAARARLQGVTFHVLRHTFASILISQGRDPVFAARQLGHANPAITLKVYAHLFDAARHAREARNQLEAEYGDIVQPTRRPRS
jgi:integrase